MHLKKAGLDAKIPPEATAAAGLSSFAAWCRCAQHPSPLPKWAVVQPGWLCGKTQGIQHCLGN